MTLAVSLLCAKLLQRSYDAGFIQSGSINLSDLGVTVKAVIWGEDDGVGPVAYGFISDGAAGLIATFRGTQMPEGSPIEWLEDFKAELVACPFAINARVHAGFLDVYKTLTAGSNIPIGQFLRTIQGPLICCGHSLGAPLATYAAIESLASGLVLFASPKPGDGGLAATRNESVQDAISYSNPNDVVPKVPITIPEIEPFEHAVPETSVGPGNVPGDWVSSHRIQGYLSLLQSQL